MRHDGHGIAKVQLVAATIATVALVLAVISLNAEIDSRRGAAKDLCIVIRGLVYSATPPSRLPEARVYVKRNHLEDCGKFADRIVK